MPLKNVKVEWERALEEKNCDKLLELFDYYIDSVGEEKLEEELNRIVNVALNCEDPYGLLHEIAHIYAYLGDEEKALESYRKIVELKKENPLEYAEALYYLAEAYEHFGMIDKAIETYEKLLELEMDVLKNERETALTLANLAANYNELGNTEKAIELMERAREVFERIGDERNYMISLIDLAHFHYELENYEIAEKLIKRVLRSPRDSEIDVNAKLVEAEINAGKGDYEKSFRALKEALFRAGEISDDLFDVVFDALSDFIGGLLTEGKYRPITENMEMFVELFEDDTRYFFYALKELARWRSGIKEAKESFEEFYSNVKNEELKALLDEWKRPRLNLNLGLM